MPDTISPSQHGPFPTPKARRPTRLGRSSSVVYDMLGRVVQQIATDPDGIGAEVAPVTTYTFDANGNLLAEADPLGSVTASA